MNFDYQLYESGLSAHGCWEKFDEYDREALEKFAELIVKECIKELWYKSIELLDTEFYPHYKQRLESLYD